MMWEGKYRFSMSIHFSFSWRNRFASPYARIVASPDRLSEKWEYNEDLNTASVGRSFNWGIAQTADNAIPRRCKHNDERNSLPGFKGPTYLQLSSTGTIERCRIGINDNNA